MKGENMTKRILLYLLAVLFTLPMTYITKASDNIQIDFRFVYKDPAPHYEEVLLKNDRFFANRTSILSINDITSASVVTQDEGFYEKGSIVYKPMPALLIQFKEDSKKKLHKLTSENINKRLGIFINGQLIMAPIIMQPISSGSVTISGKFTKEETLRIVNDINKRIALRGK
jgi:preprotein translocase subunit SecD